MPTKRKVKAVVDAAGQALEECWATLACNRSIQKHGEFVEQAEFHRRLLGFQPRLATAIHNLDNLHLQIKHRHRAVIREKGSIWKTTHAKRLKLLARYDKVVAATLQIGKTIGDAFAWLFYVSNKDLLANHLQHQAVKHTPGGKSGKGELAFVNNLQQGNGHLVLYHGNTNILRIGDVSFIDLSDFSVTGLGELKSCEVSPGLFHLALHMLGPTSKIQSIYPAPIADRTLPEQAEVPPDLPQRMKDQLQRQIQSMSDAFDPRKECAGHSMNIGNLSGRDSFVSLCQRVESQACAWQKCGEGLVLLAMSPGQGESFSARMFAAVLGRESWQFGDLESNIKSILLPEHDPHCKWNSISVGTFSPFFLIGTVPFCWWAIDTSIIKAILFQEIILMHFFNPAFLIKRLIAEGFTVRPTGIQNDFVASKVVGKGQYTIPEWQYFKRLITDHLIPEDSVVEMINATVSHIISDNVPVNSKVEMLIDFRTGRPPGESPSRQPTPDGPA